MERARKAAVATNVSFPDIFSSPPPSSLEDVLRELGDKNSASASLFMAVMSNDERDELTFSTKEDQLIEKLVRRKFEAFADCVELYCGKDLVPGEEILERILMTVRERGADLSESQSSSSVAAAEEEEEEEEVSGDKEATPEKPPKKKKEMRVVAAIVPSKKKKKRETRERVVVNEVPKQPVRKKKQKQEEAKEEENVSEYVQREGVLTLMRVAEVEHVTIVELAKNGPDLSASAARMEAPDPAKLAAAQNIVKDVEALRACLCDVAPTISSIEGLGVLLSWWRVVDRACRMRAIFTELRDNNGGDGQTLRMRYGELASKVSGTAVCFEQAWRYERLGGFLAEFPQFVFQRQLVTVADWFQNVEGEKGVLLDVLSSIVPLSSVFLKDRFELHRDGFVVYPSVLKDLVSDELVALCKMHFDDDAGEDLFNNHRDVGSRRNDGLRLQRTIDAGELAENEMAMRLKRAIVETLKREHPLHGVKGDKSMVVLMSRKKCKAQLAHTDFSKDTLAPVKNSDEKMPLACLVALMDDTAFDVWPGAIRFDESRKIKPLQVRLNAGDMFVFRGDLVHGGAAVGEQENVRIHAYIDVEGVIRPKEEAIDETYFMYEKKYILPRPKKW